IDRLTAPRLVEYWEQNPCVGGGFGEGQGIGAGMAKAAPGRAAAEAKDLGVKVEAQFAVGEYEVVILSAKDSSGLETWLLQNKYKIPNGAEPYLRPYVQQESKFFVAKVDPAKVKRERMGDGPEQTVLSPLRFHYDSEKFTLPIRLGLINSGGT